MGTLLFYYVHGSDEEIRIKSVREMMIMEEKEKSRELKMSGNELQAGRFKFDVEKL